MCAFAGVDAFVFSFVFHLSEKYLFHKPFGLMANKKSENEHHTACGTFVRRRQTGIILAILLGRKSPWHKTKKASNISRRTQEYY